MVFRHLTMLKIALARPRDVGVLRHVLWVISWVISECSSSLINHSLIISREGLILTLSILPCPQGWISWSIPRDRIDDEENVRTPPKLGKYLEIHPLRPWDFPQPSRFPSGFALGKSLGSREISRASGMDFPIPPSSWWSTDTIHYGEVKKLGQKKSTLTNHFSMDFGPKLAQSCLNSPKTQISTNI